MRCCSSVDGAKTSLIIEIDWSVFGCQIDRLVLIFNFVNSDMPVFSCDLFFVNHFVSALFLSLFYNSFVSFVEVVNQAVVGIG